jgi:hypothetical protein
MKTQIFATAVAGMFLLQAGTVSSQPARLDPATGLPEAPVSPPIAARAVAGRSPILQSTPASDMDAISAAVQEVHELMVNGLYQEALQRCLAFHEQYKSASALIPLISDWVELGRRYSEAKTALINIRDKDVQEFAAGRGYFDLFAEVNLINSFLHQEDSTYSLYQSFRDQDPDLAQQCYETVEGLLVARGEYQWCYDHLGDPQARFDTARQFLALRLDNQKRMDALNAANQQRYATMFRRNGFTNAPIFQPINHSAMMKRSAEDNFVGQTRRLIEILVATGHQGEAGKIRKQALAVLDDERLKTAINDAEAKLRQPPGSARNGPSTP